MNIETRKNQFREPNWINEHPKQVVKKEDWKPTTPPKPTIDTLFPNLDRWSIGFEQAFSTLKSLADSKAPSYPPYNVIKNGDKYVIDVALAGFKKDEIEVSVVDHTLTISTSGKAKIPTGKVKAGVEILYQGIAKREFALKFAMSEYVEVVEATMEDGVLMIVCENKVPEALLPKKIDIN